MMPEEEEHLRMSSGELVEKTHPYNTVSEKNGDSKRPGEASNDDNDCKKSKKKKKWKSKMKEVVRKLKYRVAVLENERESLKSMLSTILKHLEVQKKVRNQSLFNIFKVYGTFSKCSLPIHFDISKG